MNFEGTLSANLLRSVFDELPLGVRVACAPSGEIVYANKTSAEILGSEERWTLQDRQGRPIPDTELPFARVLRDKARVVVEDLVVADGSSRRHLRVLAQPLTNPRGEVTHVVMVWSDVSAQVEAELEAESARERFSIALAHAPVIVFTTDRKGIITVTEGAALRALGFRTGELLGLSAFEIYRDDPVVTANLRRALAGESFTTITQHGPTTLESWIGPFRNEANEVQGIIGISTDVTERQRLARQVAHADRISALGKLAASVAHEINNPLSYTLEALRLCEERASALPSGDPAVAALRNELRQLLGDAAEGAERVRLITRDLTEFARADAGPSRAVPLDTAAITASKLVAKRSAAKGDVVLDLACARSVRADEHRLVQVFVNLILNAADALPAHARERQRIRVSTRSLGAHALIEVADTGPGVSDTARAHLFEPFYSTKPAGEGTGLGLYVTRNIVTSLGGTIEALTAPEGGALFRIHLPLMAAAELDRSPAAEPEIAAPVRSDAPRAHARPRVMVIDDEAVLAQVFAMSLQGDYEVDVFERGRDALEKLLSGARYDLVFCDLMMRDLNGMQLYEELATRAPGRERELVFMTGGTFDPEVSAFVARIPNPCITKPFDIRGEVRRRITAPG